MLGNGAFPHPSPRPPPRSPFIDAGGGERPGFPLLSPSPLRGGGRGEGLGNRLSSTRSGPFLAGVGALFRGRAGRRKRPAPLDFSEEMLYLFLGRKANQSFRNPPNSPPQQTTRPEQERQAR